jgi:RHS repeat-associated protein
MVARTEGNETVQFDYDYDNRLVRIVYPNGGEVRFGYDGLGWRVFRQEGSNVRYFYYDGDKIIAEREGNSWVVRYLLGLKSCSQVVSGQVRIYHADRLGSVRWVTDGSGNLVASYVYEGFGKIVGQGGSEVVPYRFCGLWGYRNDGDAGLLHVGARYYEVETGRWVQKDPLYWSGYEYCLGDPINLTDPNGLQPASGQNPTSSQQPSQGQHFWWEKIPILNKIGEMLKEPVDLVLSWYLAKIEFDTAIKLREQLKRWQPKKPWNEIDWNIFDRLIKYNIQESTKTLTDTAIKSYKQILDQFRP